MEGFMHWRIAPWMRRLITRLCAIIPAIILIALRGDNSVTDLLTLSQVVLAIQLPLAMVPLALLRGSRAPHGRREDRRLPARRRLGLLPRDHGPGHLRPARRHARRAHNS
jgi:Mn2+/Fe2+ NRAMP family transporter